MTTTQAPQCTALTQRQNGNGRSRSEPHTILELMHEALREVTIAIEDYTADWNTDRPTDVTVLLPQLQFALRAYDDWKGTRR